MLLRGIYTFEPRPEDHDHTLPFSCNETLLFLDVLKRDPNWLRVVDIFGRVGYVPKIFVEPDENYSNHDLILSFLVDAVVKARQNKLSSASNLEYLRDALRENPGLIRQRGKQMADHFHSSQVQEEAVSSKARRSTSEMNMKQQRVIKATTFKQTEDYRLRRATSESELDTGYRTSKPHAEISTPRPAYTSETENDGYISETSVKTALEGSDDSQRQINAKPCRKTSPSVISAPSPSLQAIKSSLVNVVQETSGLNPILSENLLLEVFQCIKNSTNQLPVPMQSLLEKLSLNSMTSPVPSKAISDLEKVMISLTKFSRDGIKLGRRSSGMCIPSSEQQKFLEKLEKLRKSLVDCDSVHATQLLQLGQHAFSQDFAHLYHLESPQRVKERMLDILLIITALDKKGRAILLSTTLPIFLARDLMAQTGNHGNARKFSVQLVDVLVSLLSSGEPMPNTHFEILGTGFVNFILKEIEIIFMTSSENEYDKIADERFSSMINLILAYNLQFSQPTLENIVLKVLAECRKRPRGFLTILTKLFRKGYDPLQIEDQDSCFGHTTPHSIFKIMTDICLCKRTSSKFSNADKKTLMEIITEGLLDNPAGSTRLGCLQILKGLLGSLEPGFNLANLRAALLSILLDSDPLAITEQQLLRGISKEFPVLFIQSISRVKMSKNHDSSAAQGNTSDENDCFYLSS